METRTIRRILLWSREFRAFWKEHGPFRYALTSREFPPVLLEPEEWLFSDDLTQLLKELMGWEERGMSLVPAPFNPGSTKTLKPEDLSAWKINRFPAEWESAACPVFTPSGHLTLAGTERAAGQDPESVEIAFFRSLADHLDSLGYVLLRPDPHLSGIHAHIGDYLGEWEEDEGDEPG